MLLLALVGIAACGDLTQPEPAVEASLPQFSAGDRSVCRNAPDDLVVTFEDAVLEAAIMDALSVSTPGELTCGLLAALTTLTAGGDPITGHVTTVAGIQNLASLIDLGLGFNSIDDIRALSRLTGLTRLDLELNAINDIRALRRLRGLTWLNLDNNSIPDVRALRKLTSLTFLSLSDNSISEVRALRGLTSLTELHLSMNPDLADIGPLLANPGLGVGDVVKLESTSVACADVALLEAKGVTVSSDCP